MKTIKIASMLQFFSLIYNINKQDYILTLFCFNRENMKNKLGGRELITL